MKNCPLCGSSDIREHLGKMTCFSCSKTFDDAIDVTIKAEGDKQRQSSQEQTISDPPETLFVPFVRGSTAGMNQQISNIGGRDTGNPAVMGVAGELTELVKKHKSMGYEFQKIETIHVDVSPGCIGMLMGKGKEYHPYDYLVFKKSDSQQFANPV